MQPGGATGWRHPVGDFREGMLLLAEGAGFLRRQPRLWPLALLPVLLALLFVGGTVWAFWQRLDWIHGTLAGWLPALEASAWWSWLWVAPGLALFWLIGWLAVLLAFGVSLVAGLLLANLVAAPFLDQLSQRVEELATGRAETESGGLSGLAMETLRSFGAELQRLGFLGGLWILLSLAGVVVPGAQLITAPVLVAVTVLFLPLDYCGFALDRRQVPFRERRRWVLDQLPLMIGFGGVAFLACFVPGLNLLIWPALVTAGTLLVVRRKPSGESDEPGEERSDSSCSETGRSREARIAG